MTDTWVKLAEAAQAAVMTSQVRFLGTDSRAREIAELWRSEAAAEAHDAVLDALDVEATPTTSQRGREAL